MPPDMTEPACSSVTTCYAEAVRRLFCVMSQAAMRRQDTVGGGIRSSDIRYLKTIILLN